MKLLLVLMVVLPQQIWCGQNILRLDITPEEAQQYISGASSILNYAPKLDTGALPADRPSYHLGKIIEQPEQFYQETYLANQFHGQDGLGKAKFGYSDWNQARVEDINVHGKTEGSYKYVNPNGENYEVKYWADSEGFHQTDNRPVVPLVPVTDTPEVQAARLAHEKAWSEAAAANLVSSVYPQLPQTYSQVPDPSNEQYAYKKYEHQEEKYDSSSDGPPRGFFYSFDYAVPLIVDKNAPPPPPPPQ